MTETVVAGIPLQGLNTSVVACLQEHAVHKFQHFTLNVHKNLNCMHVHAPEKPVRCGADMRVKAKCQKQ